jgi:hypothetical protein
MVIAGAMVFSMAALSMLLQTGCGPCSNPPRYLVYQATVRDATTGQPVADQIVLVRYAPPDLEGQALQDYLNTQLADASQYGPPEELFPWVRKTGANGMFTGPMPLKPVPADIFGCPQAEALKQALEHPSLAVSRFYMYIRIGQEWQEVTVAFSDADIHDVDGLKQVVLPAICVSPDGVSVCESIS